MKTIKKWMHLLLLALLTVSCSQEKGVDLKVLQLNTWIHGEWVAGAPEGMVDLIDRTDPDVVLLCELDAGSETPLVQKLLDGLSKRGKTYYSDGKNAQTGVLSKYTLDRTSVLLPTSEKNRPMIKTSLSVNGQTVVIYSAHLDHLNYAPYLPRGYSGTTWKPMDRRVTNPDSILAANRLSLRDEAIRGFLLDAKAETAKGHLVILGGDFNEPAHTDWQADTKDLRDHGGAVVNWDVSLMLQQSGYMDAFRQRFPNPVTHPGFTWPAGNPAAKLESLFYTPTADERERIDFIYYYPQPGFTLGDIHIVGPAASVDHGKITPDDDTDDIVDPGVLWPSDHKGNLATFRIAPPSPVAINADRKLTFAFLTDIHLNCADNGDRHNGLRLALDRVKNTTTAEFILLGGDLVDISGMGQTLPRERADSLYTAFKQTMDKAGLPYYPAIGNHDRYFHPEAGGIVGDEVFRSHLGPSYYTFEQKGIRFFVLNAVQRSEAGELSVGNEELEWLQQELVHVPLATPLVVVLHVPLYSLYYPVVEGKFGPWDVVCNYKEVLRAFREHNLKLVLQGHQHVYEEIFSQQVQYITGGAVCAGWWSGSFHGTEEGFLLVNVSETNEFTWEYVDYGWSPKRNR
ncbi:MAG: metallophosphoesterase [Bacteroidales bacterium]|jgi:endonuclease/exonuclease/phosphatase family metal-dependent hydrolase/UDP-2,3-diacylglucosamine pyrophosphatase LpxH|nr:metallophosphoesterase [Bacteroidales bacterium]